MKIINRRYLAVLLTVCMIIGGWSASPDAARAATFAEINQDSVFLKQPGGSSLCTLVAAAMMVRRGAMMNGNENWASISTDMMRSAAWVEGTGLKWNFVCGGMTVAHGAFSGSASDLQAKLAEHPEGIVLYKQKTDQQHAILVTDYTDGVFYCADPSGAVAAGRIPLSDASIKIEDANFIWYISDPVLYLTDDSGKQIPHVVDTAKPDSTPKPTATARPAATAGPKVTSATKPKTTTKPKETSEAKPGTTTKPKKNAETKPKTTAKPKADGKEWESKSNGKVTVPGKVKGVKVTNKKKKTLTITWEKTSGAKGYQVRFATTRKIPKGSAFVNLTGHRAALTDLKKGSVFYVKVRAYKLKGKKKVFGAYSGIQKGKVKK